MVLTSTAVPGRADAERAAAVLADAGVARVELFGSVARGEAAEHSDIDLIAIYDDLDYPQRWQKELELVAAAKAAAGYPVDVVVTDRPEWVARMEGVRASLPNRTARDRVVLVDRSHGAVDWEKEMVMPVDDYQEALYRLGLVDTSLIGLRERLEPGSVERLEQRMGNEVRALDIYLVRLRRTCGEVQGVVEASIKSLIHLGGSPVAAWGHDIASLCEQLAEPHRSVVPILLKPHGPDAITAWPARSRYHREASDPKTTADVVGELARMACRVAYYTADQFPDPHRTIDAIRQLSRSVEDYLGGFDLRTGEPLRRHGSAEEPSAGS